MKKEPYLMSLQLKCHLNAQKEPYMISKEPSIMTKEPYRISKERYLMSEELELKSELKSKFKSQQ